MSTYLIFEQQDGKRIAINPETVTAIVEDQPGRVLVVFPSGGSTSIPMTLENVVARLEGRGEPGPGRG